MAYPSTEPGELVLPARDSARQSLDAALPGWRSAYEIIVVDVPELTTSPLGAHIASIADGVIIALYPDRRVKPADGELTMLLSQLGTSIFGVVRTARQKNKATRKKSKVQHVRSRVPSVQHL
jgi:Mrp family chromosome partitioning ATPase